MKSKKKILMKLKLKDTKTKDTKTAKQLNSKMNKIKKEFEMFRKESKEAWNEIMTWLLHTYD